MSEFSRNLAVVIGINQYSSGISSLSTAVNDAKGLVEILRLKHKYQVWVLLDELATLKNINRLLSETLPQQITSDDRLLFYFAGHGTIDGEGEDGPTGYLIPQDAKRGDLKSYLPMTQLYESLNKLPCRHFLGIFDCCFAGAFRWLTTRDLLAAPEKIYQQRYDRYIKDPAWQIITSAAYDQKALDIDPFAFERGQIGNNSPFAAVLLAALQGEAEEDSFKEGVITATKLYSYLRDRIEPLTEAKGKRQTPTLLNLRRHDKGEYIFLSPGHRLNLEDAPPLKEKDNPYKGLQSFEEEDSQLFFGRQALREQLYSRITQQPLTIVLGASGSGKSSLVKAGLIPNFKEKNPDWHILAPIRPGELPFSALRNAFAKDNFPVAAVTTLKGEQKIESLLASLDDWFKLPKNSNLLIVIDQAEELITLCQDEQEREAFLRLLARALENYQQKLRIVFTLRSDFETQVRSLALEPYWQATGARFFVEDMTREELRQVIEEPASKKVIFFEPHNLVEKLIDEVHKMPGALPLLSFTLSELYLKYLRSVREEGRNNRAIAQTDYQELGGILGSITKRADEEYMELVKDDEAYELTIRNVMLRMVAVGDGELARRRVSETELFYPETENSRVNNVINQFVEARLLVKDEDEESESYIEPAHDALISRWEKILAWKKEKQENLILQRRLTPAAEEWNSVKSKEQRSGFQAKTEPVIDWLDRGFFTVENLVNKIPARLARLLRRDRPGQERARENSVQFLWNANPALDLLDKDINSDDSLLNQIEAEFVRQSILRKRKNIRWRWRIAIAVMLGLSGLTIAALIGQRNSQIGQIKAFQQTSEANLRSNQELDALIESLRAGKSLKQPFLQLVKPDNQIQNQLKETLQKAVYQVKEHNRLQGGDSASNVIVSFSPHSQLLATAGDDGTVRLWNLQGKNLEEWNTDPRTNLSFSPDGQLLATAGDGSTIRLWNLQGQLLKKWNTHQGNWLSPVSFNPHSQLLATAGENGTIRLWNLQGQMLKEWNAHPGWIWNTSFSPDGQLLATVGASGIVRLWDLQGQQWIGWKASQYHLRSVNFSPNGQHLATAGDEGIARLWNLQGHLLKEFNNPKIAYSSVSFSPDGQVATYGKNGTVAFWDLQGQMLTELKVSQGVLTSISFSPDGRMLAAAGNSDIAHLWDLQGQPLTELKGHQQVVKSVSFSPDGQRLTTVGENGTVGLWNLQGQPLTELKGHQQVVKSVSFSPDSQRFATAGDDDTVRLWDLQGQPLTELKGNDRRITSVSFSPDGQQLATVEEDGIARLWDLMTGQPLIEFPGKERDVNSVSFSPDGQRLATIEQYDKVHLWDLQGQHVAEVLVGHRGGVSSFGFSPDNKLLATAGNDGIVRVWKLQDQPLTQQLSVWQAMQGSINNLKFSPDGQQIVTAGEDGTVRLWDLQGQPLATWKVDQGQVWSVSFSPDGQLLATAGSSGNAKLWRIESFDELMKRGCNWVRDYLKNNSKSDRTLCDDVPKVVAEDKSF